MDTKQPELEKDIDLMPYHQEVEPPASLNPEAEQVPSKKEDIEILGDNSKEEMHNISLDESQHRVVQSCKASTLDGHTYPTHFEEWVIVYDVRKHLAALVDATKAYAEATSSSFHFLITENKRMAKALQMAKKGGELVTASAWVDLKKVILDEVYVYSIQYVLNFYINYQFESRKLMKCGTLYVQDNLFLTFYCFQFYFVFGGFILVCLLMRMEILFLSFKNTLEGKYGYRF